MTNTAMIKLNDMDGEEELPDEKIKKDFNKNETNNTDNLLTPSVATDNILLYGLKQKPPVVISVLLAIQIVIIIVINVIWLPYVNFNSLCIHPEDPARVEIISLNVLSSGISTLISSTFGLRVPILMIPSTLYIDGFLNILRLPNLQCPGLGDLYAMGHTNRTIEWQKRYNYLQGGILMMSLFHFLLGITGGSCLFDGLVSKPLVLVPTVILIGFSFGNQILSMITLPDAHNSSVLEGLTDWGTISLTIGVIIIAAFKFQKIDFVTPHYSFAKGCTTSYFKFFKLLPVLFAVLVALVVYPVLSIIINGRIHKDATSLHRAFETSDLFQIHKPFPFGWPLFNAEAFLGILPGGLIQIFLSIIIYRAVNFIYGEDVRQKYINRGVCMDGFSGFIAGLFGCTAVNSPANMGLMKLTGVGSRWVMQVTGIVLILFSFSTKILKILVDIPPIFVISIIFIVSALISGTGLLMMQKINMKSLRNCTILGLTLYAGIVIPNFVNHFSSKNLAVQILLELLSSSVMISIIVGSILNLIIPESKELDGQPESPGSNRNNLENFELSPCEEILACCL